MRKVFTILIALMLSFTWASAQSYSNVGNILYSQLDSVVNDVTFYSSWNAGGSFNGGTYYAADDFVVPAGGWKMKGFTFISSRPPSYFYSSGAVFNLTVYDDTSTVTEHKPANIYATSAITIPYRQTAYDSLAVQLGYNVWQYNLKIPFSDTTNFSLDEGTYWVSIVPQGTFISNPWLTSKRVADFGYPAKQKDIAAMPLTYTNWSTKADAGNDDLPATFGTPGTVFYHNLEFAILGVPDSTDLSVKKIISPEHGEMTSNHSVIVKIENSGINTIQDFQVKYEVSGIIDYVPTLIGTATENVTGANLAANATMEYTFTQKVDLSALSTYTIKAIVKAVNDTNVVNDTLVRAAKNIGELYIMGTDRFVTACSGTFTDDQGIKENPYTVASWDTITFYPGETGKRISLDYTYFDLAKNDPTSITFYDGATTASPVLFQYLRNQTWAPGSPIKARNADGIITVLTKQNQTTDARGWQANVACFSPFAIDFMVLSTTVGSSTVYNQVGKPVNVQVIYTSSSSDTTARRLYLLENDVVVQDVMSKTIKSGQVDTINFTWIPGIAMIASQIKVSIQDDPQPETNADNSMTKTVDVYRSGILLESFESTTTTAPPLEWISKLNTAATGTSFPKHGLRTIKTLGIDTLIMPLMNPVAGDSLKFWAYIPGNGTTTKKYTRVMASKTLTGPWTLVDTARWISSAMNEYKFDLTPFNDGPYYFAFVAATNCTVFDANYIDHVRGGPLYHYDNDLLAKSFTATDTYIKTDREFVFQATVNNVGLQNVLGNSYTVSIRTVDSVYSTVKGVDVISNGSAIVEIPCMFATPATLSLFAEIVYSGEIRVDNNATRKTNFIIVDDFTYSLPINTSSVTLMGINRKSSMSETIYYPKEVGLYGSLKGVEYVYSNSGTTAVAGVPVKLYVGTTRFASDSVFGAYVAPNGYPWIESDSIPAGMTLVYDGTLNFAASITDKPFYIPFSIPYNYDGTNNLVIMLVKGVQTSTVTTISFKNAIKKDTGFGTRMLTGYNNSGTAMDPVAPACTNAAGTLVAANSGGSSIPKTRFYFENGGAPVFESTPITNVNEFEIYTDTAEIEYTSLKPFTMTASGMPSWMSFTKLTDTTYTLTGTASTVGSYPIKLVATDGSYSATQRFTLDAHAVPVFVSTPVEKAVINNLYTYTAAVTYNGSGFATLSGDAGNPAWVSVNDNGDNTATVSGTPTIADNYSVKVIANGAYGTMAEQVYSIEVAAGPTFVGITDQYVNEMEVYNESVSLQYFGTEDVTVTTNAEFPTWLSLSKNSNTSFTITGTAVMGEYPIELYATNGIRKDTARYTLYVYDTPEITSSPVVLKLVNEEYTYNVTVDNFGVGATTIAGHASNPSWVTVTDNGDRTATVSGIPTLVGDYDITIVVTGEGGLTDEQIFTVAVGAEPQFPFTSTVYMNEGETHNSTITVTYVGIRTLTISKGETFPSWLTLTDNGDKTATLDGTAPQYGEYPIQLVATDGIYSDTLDYQFTVYDQPVFSSTPITKATLGKNYKYDVIVTNNGLGANVITGDASNPSWISVTDNGDKTATVLGVPTAIGDFTITLMVTGAGGFANTQVYTLSVGAGPDFTAISDKFANEGTPYSQTVGYSYQGTDTPVVTEGASFPSWLTITNNANNTATLTGDPIVGVHPVQLIVADALNADTIDYTITVYALPVFESTPADLVMLVNEVFNYTAIVSNSGLGATTITGKSGNPSWISVTDNGDLTANVTGTPTMAGIYEVTLVATGENGAITEQTFTIEVGVVPAFESMENVVLNDMDTYNGTATVTYEGLGTIVISKGTNFPAWLTLTDNGNKTATITGIAVTGEYTVELNVTDGTYSNTVSYLISVKALPIFASTPVTYDIIGNEYAYAVEVTLAEGFATITGEGNPAWISVTDNGDNTATVTGTAAVKGDYTITLVATSATGGFVEQVYTLTIGEGPTFNAISDELIKEGDDYSNTASVVYDGIGTAVISAGTNMPSWLTVTDNGDHTATISGNNAATGVYTVELEVTDGINSDAISYVLTVGAVPVFTSTPEPIAMVDYVYTYTAEVAYTGTDVLSLVADELPSWLAFTDNGDNTATITGTAISTGFYPVVIKATGEFNSVTQSFDIEVKKGAVPTFTSTPIVDGMVNQLYTYTATVTYTGTDVLTIVADELPTWMAFTDNGDKTATLTGTPTEVGVYSVSITAKGQYYSTTQSFDVNVIVNDIDENGALNYVVYPNPTSEWFTISNSENTTIEVVDLRGNVVKLEKITAANQKIDISMLSQGIYMVVISNNTGKVSQRLVIE